MCENAPEESCTVLDEEETYNLYVDLSLRLKYPVYNKGPKLMRNNKGVWKSDVKALSFFALVTAIEMPSEKVEYVVGLACNILATNSRDIGTQKI